MNMLTKNIVFSFLLLSCVFFITIVVTQYKVNGITELSREIQHVYEPSVQANLRMTNALNMSMSSLYAWVLHRDVMYKRRRLAAWSVIGKMQNRLENHSLSWRDSEQNNRLQLVIQDLRKLKQYQDEAERISSQGENARVTDLLKNRVIPTSELIIANLRKISDPQYWQMERIFIQEERQEKALMNMALFFLLVSVALSMGLAILMMQSVITPLNRMVKFAGDIASGRHKPGTKQFNPRDKLDLALKSMSEQLLDWQKKSENQRFELSEYNQELKAVNLQLAQANDELSQFSYRTSHDLKAPLITIRKLAELMLEDISEQHFDDVRMCAENIAELVCKLENLVEDILNLSKADLYDFEREQVNLRQVVDTVVVNMAKVYTDKGVCLETHVDPCIDMFISRARLIQVLGNLVSNGIKYADADKLNPYVRVHGCYEDGKVKLVVEDNGLGLPESSQAKLFAMFQRFHPQVAVGSGLGLYIVKKHLDKMQISIAVESSNQGTRFELIFPPS